eukprot:c12991_g1_i3.p1 GENE.c12991_g1_i3~~c12991_g1_i3.p1  ORF type:complete len:302 (+),score=94.80 c12991_g1_i3:1-906(+)
MGKPTHPNTTRSLLALLVSKNNPPKHSSVLIFFSCLQNNNPTMINTKMTAFAVAMVCCASLVFAHPTTENDDGAAENKISLAPTAFFVHYYNTNGVLLNREDITAAMTSGAQNNQKATYGTVCDYYDDGLGNRVYTVTTIGEVYIADSSKAAIYCNTTASSYYISRYDAFTVPGDSAGTPSSQMSNAYDCMFRHYSCIGKANPSNTYYMFGHTGGSQVAKPFVACDAAGSCRLRFASTTAVDNGQFFTFSSSSGATTMLSTSSGYYAAKDSSSPYNMIGAGTGTNFRVCPYPYDSTSWTAC